MGESLHETTKAILSGGIVAIIRKLPFEHLDGVASALASGGIRCIEVTFDQKGDPADTTKAIQYLASHFGGRVHVGAGTVVSPAQAAMAIGAGASYIISPNFSPAVVQETKSRGAVSIPGTMSPTEIMAAFDSGADIVKLFPASVLGVDYIKAVKAPISHIPLMAVGGIDAENIAAFQAAGCVCFGIGSNIVNMNYAKNGEYGKIEALAREFLARLG